jgi:hypothetical protein
MMANVIRGMKNFFETGQMPLAVNETVIVLIPKKNEPEFLRDFRQDFGSWGHGTRSDTQAALSQEAGAGVTGGGEASELAMSSGIARCHGHVGVCEHTSDLHLDLELVRGVPSLQGTGSGPRAHLKRGSEPVGGANIFFPCFFMNFVPWYSEAVGRPCQCTRGGPRSVRDAIVHGVPDGTVTRNSSQWLVTAWQESQGLRQS